MKKKAKESRKPNENRRNVMKKENEERKRKWNGNEIMIMKMKKMKKIEMAEMKEIIMTSIMSNNEMSK